MLTSALLVSVGTSFCGGLGLAPFSCWLTAVDVAGFVEGVVEVVVTGVVPVVTWAGGPSVGCFVPVSSSSSLSVSPSANSKLSVLQASSLGG